MTLGEIDEELVMMISLMQFETSPSPVQGRWPHRACRQCSAPPQMDSGGGRALHGT